MASPSMRSPFAIIELNNGRFAIANGDKFEGKIRFTVLPEI
jgi:hypothetical protein